jgi:hypothetical protein
VRILILLGVMTAMSMLSGCRDKEKECIESGGEWNTSLRTMWLPKFDSKGNLMGIYPYLVTKGECKKPKEK